MRGYPDYNFPAFDKAEKLAHSNGFDLVLNPATMDRGDCKESIARMSEIKRQEYYAKRDTNAIFLSTHVAMLPGWEKSIGARAEYALAVWIGREILDATDFTPLETKELTYA